MLGLKYLTGLPVNRFNQLFSGIDYEFKSSTIFGGFEKLLGYMMPLYEAIVAYNQSESRWNADETSWCRLLDDDEKKKRLFWMWVFVGKQSVAYVLDPTRSKKVPENHFKNTNEGIVNVDRYASYNVLSHKLILAYCWYHLRRDFIRVGKKNKSFSSWTLQWLKKIREIEKLNDSRVERFINNETFEAIQQKLVTKVDAFFSDASQSLQDKTLKNEQLKTLESMLKRREGYSVFVDHSDIDMHNNTAERQFRHVAWARNNYNGSQSKWGGILAAVVWTIFKTAQMNGLDPVAYLKFYLECYALKNEVPENLQELLPWNCKDPKVIVQKESG
jgi:transposase